MINFTSNEGKWSYMSDTDYVKVSTKEKDGKLTELVQVAFNEAQKMIGMWLAPDGINNRQIEEMKESNIEWA